MVPQALRAGCPVRSQTSQPVLGIYRGDGSHTEVAAAREAGQSLPVAGFSTQQMELLRNLIGSSMREVLATQTSRVEPASVSTITFSELAASHFASHTRSSPMLFQRADRVEC